MSSFTSTDNFVHSNNIPNKKIIIQSALEERKLALTISTDSMVQKQHKQGQKKVLPYQVHHKS